MDKSRFLSLSVLNSVALRTVLYPLTVIKTRLQVQKGKNPVYTGTLDAFVKIIRNEGRKLRHPQRTSYITGVYHLHFSIATRILRTLSRLPSEHDASGIRNWIHREYTFRGCCIIT